MKLKTILILTAALSFWDIKWLPRTNYWPTKTYSPATNTFILRWTYEFDTVFNIYTSTNLHIPLTNWQRIATTPNLYWINTASNQSRFFFITASNTLTHIESPPIGTGLPQ